MSLEIQEPQSLPLTRDVDGAIHVSGTRVTLDTVVDAFQQGATAEEIIQQYPPLALADVYAVLAYYLAHTPEVDGYLNDRKARRDSVRRDNEVRHDPSGIRQRLLARKS